MKQPVLLLSVLATASACDAPSTTATGAAADTTAAAPGSPAATPAPPAMTTPIPSSAPVPTPYEVRGVIDPGLHSLVAMAFKIPRGWQLQQSFTRKWNGSTPIPQISLRVTAPDGQRELHFLPERPYFYHDGPTARSLRQTAASMGLPPQPSSPYELAPMAPLAYIQHVLLPDLARQGLHFQVTSQFEAPHQGNTASAYVDGHLPTGRRVRVECLLTTNATNMNGEVYYNWTARPTITMSNGDLAASFAYVQAARASVAFNPVWQQANQQLQHNGQVADQEILRRDEENVRAYRDNQRRNHDELTRQRGESQDRNNEAFRDALGPQARYDNAATGERVRTDDRYNHVYQDRNGTLHGSNVPLDAGALDWQELQKVETKNY